MSVHQRWVKQLKNNIIGIMQPTEDPVDPSVFYVSDGLFSTYSSMRFRQFSMETGEELANALTRDATRCIHFEGDHIYAFLNKRIIKLRKNGLAVVDTYREKVPNCADYVSMIKDDTFLIGNNNADSLTVFNVQTKQTSRKKIGGCCGIFKTEQDRFLVFNYHSILSYSSGENKLCKLTDTETHTECAMGESGRAYLLCGGVGYSGPKITSAAYKILVYSLSAGTALERTVDIPQEILGSLCSHMHFRLSKDETLLYLYDARTVWIYSVHENKIVFHYTFPSGAGLGGIHDVFTDQSFLIRVSQSGTGCEMSGWEIHF